MRVLVGLVTARLCRARPRELAALVFCLALAAATVVGIRTQDRYTPDRTIDGLVLDGGPTTTGPVSVLPPVEPIPWHGIEGADHG